MTYIQNLPALQYSTVYYKYFIHHWSYNERYSTQSLIFVQADEKEVIGESQSVVVYFYLPIICDNHIILISTVKWTLLIVSFTYFYIFTPYLSKLVDQFI